MGTSMHGMCTDVCTPSTRDRQTKQKAENQNGRGIGARAFEITRPCWQISSWVTCTAAAMVQVRRGPAWNPASLHRSVPSYIQSYLHYLAVRIEDGGACSTYYLPCLLTYLGTYRQVYTCFLPLLCTHYVPSAPQPCWSAARPAHLALVAVSYTSGLPGTDEPWVREEGEGAPSRWFRDELGFRSGPPASAAGTLSDPPAAVLGWYVFMFRASYHLPTLAIYTYLSFTSPVLFTPWPAPELPIKECPHSSEFLMPAPRYPPGPCDINAPKPENNCARAIPTSLQDSVSCRLPTVSVSARAPATVCTSWLFIVDTMYRDSLR